MNTSDFDYDLPTKLIAQSPIEPRDHSRLLIMSKSDESIKHRRFYDLPKYLNSGDVMVLNDSRVIPARLYAHRVPTGGAVELLLLHRKSPGVWTSLVKPGNKMRRGARFKVTGGGQCILGEVVGIEPDGSRIVTLDGEGSLPVLGVVPLPPYIHERLQDPERYQTVYARNEGSVAAPTAGLHFTPELMQRVSGMGVEITYVTLHVGWDSFRRVEATEVKGHTLHSEAWNLSKSAANTINSAKCEGRRVISIGTTATRLLEQAATLCKRSDQVVEPGSGWADLFITPGYQFRVVDSLVTNFHLPRSTLLMLTSAFAGRAKVLRAYREAAKHHYRFYSFGDAMLLV